MVGGDKRQPLFHFNTAKFRGVKTSVRGHAGILGSFISISGVSSTRRFFVGLSNRHVLAKVTSITSTSSNFSIKWLLAS
jgi:hypothetical protein